MEEIIEFLQEEFEKHSIKEEVHKVAFAAGYLEESKKVTLAEAMRIIIMILKNEI